jgi:hypothetical protein
MGWSPISKSELTQRLTTGLAEVDESVRETWDHIRIEPEKWRCSPWGDEGGGFWVVAVRGDTVIWFNDIEGGFNISRFHTPGTIDEYWCNQSDFSEVLNGLPKAIAAESFAAAKPAIIIPPEIRGPGKSSGVRPPSGSCDRRINRWFACTSLASERRASSQPTTTPSRWPTITLFSPNIQRAGLPSLLRTHRPRQSIRWTN